MDGFGMNSFGMGGGLILGIAILVVLVGLYAIFRKKRVK